MALQLIHTGPLGQIISVTSYVLECVVALPTRKCKILTDFFLVQSIYGDEYIMSRMTLYKELVGHQGCVNTL